MAHHSNMDTSYTYIIIALLPFLLWSAIIFVLSEADIQADCRDSEDMNDDQMADIVTIPYGLIFPLYYHTPTASREIG
ncbi:hypothetical protein [Brucella anthropi]|uniref:hypothetical protein n=1 Tax=Brucella anthropi TaxID=529 RepID=UPI00384D0AC6